MKGELLLCPKCEQRTVACKGLGNANAHGPGDDYYEFKHTCSSPSCDYGETFTNHVGQNQGSPDDETCPGCGLDHSRS